MKEGTKHSLLSNVHLPSANSVRAFSYWAMAVTAFLPLQWVMYLPVLGFNSCTPMDRMPAKKSQSDLDLAEVETGVSVRSPKM